MSDVAIFIIGSVIFAITVYGSVMGGGIALSRLADNENDAIDEHPAAAPVIASRPSPSPADPPPSDPT